MIYKRGDMLKRGQTASLVVLLVLIAGLSTYLFFDINNSDKELDLESITGRGILTNDSNPDADSPWPMVSRNLNHSGFTTESGPLTNNTLWTFTAGNFIVTSPAIANGLIYMGSYDHKVYAINASTGIEKWNFTTGNLIISSPAIAKGLVYIGSYDNKVYALNASTGIKKWNFTTGSFVASSPAVANGRVYIGSGGSKVYALNALTGSQIWSYTTGGAIYSSPAIANGVLYVGSYDDNKVYALNSTTGSQIWNYTTRGPIGYSSPAISNGRIYIGTNSVVGGASVYSLNSTTGAQIWNYTEVGTAFNSPAIVNNLVYIGAATLGGRSVYVLNSTTGALEENWGIASASIASPIVANGIVFVGADFKVFAINSTTGAAIWSYTTGSYVSSSPAIVNGTLYIGSQDNKLYAFRTPPATIGSAPPGFVLNTESDSGGTNVTLNGTIDILFRIPSGETVNLTGVNITSTSGLTKITGLQLPSGVTKTAQVIMPSGSSSVCVDDAENATLTSSCTGPGEISVSCPGSNSGYNCTVISSTLFAVSGLGNSTIGSFLSNISSNPTPTAPWPMFHRDLNHSGSVGNNPYTKGEFIQIANFTTNHPTGGYIDTSPAIAYGRLYINSVENKTFVLNLSNLNQILNSSTARRHITNSPVIANNIVYSVGIGPLTSVLLFSYNASNLNQIANVTLEITSLADIATPAVADGRVYLSSQKVSSVFNATTLSIIANFSCGFCFPNNWQALVSHGVAYLDKQSVDIMAVDAITFSQIGNITFSDPQGITSPPTISNGILYAGGAINTVFAFNESNLVQISNFTTGDTNNDFKGAPAVYNGVVYAGSTDHRIYALNASNLAQISNFTTGNEIFSSPAVSGGVVYVTSTDHRIYALNASNLAQISNFTTGDVIESSPAVVNGTVYFGSSDNVVYALRLECVDNDGDGFNTTADCGTPIDCEDNDANVIPPTDGAFINRSVTFCPGTYNIPNRININASHITVLCNNTVINGDGVFISDIGILGGALNNVTIKNCRLQNYGIAILLSNSSDSSVLNNTAQTTLEGIRFDFRSIRNIAKDNTVNESFIGVNFNGLTDFNPSIDNIISNNNLLQISTAIAAARNQNITIFNNIISNAPDQGVLFSVVWDSSIFNNTVDDAGIGINVESEGTAGNDIFDNIITQSGSGIVIQFQAEKNRVFNNNISNAGNGIFISSSYNNISTNIIKNSTFGMYLFDDGDILHPNTFNNTLLNNTMDNTIDIFTVNKSDNNTLIILKGRTSISYKNKFINVTDIDNLFINDSIVAVNSSAEPAMNVSADVSFAVPRCNIVLLKTSGFFTDIQSANASLKINCSSSICQNKACSNNIMNFTVTEFSTIFAANAPAVIGSAPSGFVIETTSDAGGTNVTLSGTTNVSFRVPTGETINLTGSNIFTSSGLTVITGLNLPANVTKSAQVIVPSGTTQICAVDVAGVVAIAPGCSTGTIISCPGAAGKYTCVLNGLGTLATVSNLSHTAIGTFTASSGGGGGGGRACTSYWSCSDWNACTNNLQTRTCTDLSNCGTTTGKPEESRACSFCTNQCEQGAKQCLGSNIQSCSMGAEGCLVWATTDYCPANQICELGSCKEKPLEAPITAQVVEQPPVEEAPAPTKPTLLDNINSAINVIKQNSQLAALASSLVIALLIILFIGGRMMSVSRLKRSEDVLSVKNMLNRSRSVLPTNLKESERLYTQAYSTYSQMNPKKKKYAEKALNEAYDAIQGAQDRIRREEVSRKDAELAKQREEQARIKEIGMRAGMEKGSKEKLKRNYEELLKKIAMLPDEEQKKYTAQLIELRKRIK